MLRSYEDLVRRAQFLSLTCDIKDENGVVHRFHHGHEYVEIGGLKWAIMNVGAEKPTNNGLYFQWGDSKGYTAEQVGKGKKPFTWKDYKYKSSSSVPILKYNEADGKTTLDAEDDGVAVNWGGKWRTPTIEEFSVLCAAVNTAWTNNYKSTGVKGLVCTAKDGSGVELFFPAGGFCNDNDIVGVGCDGFYWSSSYHNYNESLTFSFSGSGYMNWQNNVYRCFGFSLRGIIDE